MKHRSRPTFRDLARAAGVSPSTVSRVANQKASVDPAIRQRVSKAAVKLGLDLSRNRPKVIALLLSNREVLHPYHSHVLSGAEAHCASREHSVLYLTFRYDGTTSWQRLSIPAVLEQRDLVSGFILAGTNWPNLLELLTRKQVPFSVLGDNVLSDWNPEAYDVVWSDDIHGAWEVTRYLQLLGHRDIWFAGNRRLSWFARRYRGYEKAMREAGAPVRLAEFESENPKDIGYLAMKSIFSRGEPVSAVFAAGDLVAEGVYQALRDRRIRVPEDISVAGFNDIEAGVMHPPLTSVRQFPEQVGRHLAELLLERVQQPDRPPQQVTIPTQLVKRESCARLRKDSHAVRNVS